MNSIEAPVHWFKKEHEIRKETKKKKEDIILRGSSGLKEFLL
jgi:hypothetical protein